MFKFIGRTAQPLRNLGKPVQSPLQQRFAAGSNSSRMPTGVPQENFCGSSLDDLVEWLDSAGIDTSAYGTSTSKSVDLLLQEVKDGETVLTVGEGGAALRVVHVLNVLITNSRGQLLVEARQLLPSGAVRERGKPLGEKLLPGERWQEGVVRGIREELGPALPEEPSVEVDEASYEEVVEEKESQSYPGLKSKYILHRVRAKVAGLPETDFETQEPRGDGVLTHVWVWQ